MRYFAAFTGVVVTLCAGSPALSAVTSIGNSWARLCYEAARSPTGRSDGLSHCDAAFQDALSPEDTVATYVNRGILRATGGDIDGAINDYDAALARNPDQPEAWLNKAFVYMRLGSAAKALSLFDAAIAKQTKEPALAYYGRGLAHEEAGNVRAAYADYVRARDLTPQWKAPAMELARFQIRKAAAPR